MLPENYEEKEIKKQVEYQRDKSCYYEFIFHSRISR